MEISLVRSLMNVQRSSNPERRDATSSNHGSINHPRRHTSRGQLRGGRRITRPRDIYSVICEDFERIQEVDSFRRVCFTQHDDVAPSISDGYMQAASQLQLFPGSQERLKNSNIDDVPWECIAQVVCYIDVAVCCPICLYPPVAPRMERCGHIYCAPCVAQYVHYENEGSAKKCAVCSWVLRLEDLKRVSLVDVVPLKVGSKLAMVLVGDSSNDENIVCPKSSEAPCPSVLSFVTELRQKQLDQAVQDEIALLKTFRDTSADDSTVELLVEINQLLDCLECSLRAVDNSEENSENSISVDNPSKNFIYQASDGQLIFLDGLMWKCLLTEYGSVGNLPELLEVIVSAVKTHKMTQALRKRWRHLKHVPLGHTFHLIEIELDRLVSQATLDQYASALEARFIERDRNRLEDLRLTKLKEAAENRIPSLPEGFVITGHAPLLDQPRFDPSDFVPLGAVSTDVQQPKLSTPSFADVSRMGASSVVDQNRVANFVRGPLTRRSIPSFTSNSDDFPALSISEISASSQSSFRADIPTTHWTRDPARDEQRDNAVKSCPKKHRKRRTRTRSLHDSMSCDS